MADRQSFPCDPAPRAADQETESAAVSTLQQDRYGRRPPSRRRLLVAGGLALLAALAFISWVTIAHRPALNWDDVGFNVVSDAAIEVTFDVNFSGSGASDADRPAAV